MFFMLMVLWCGFWVWMWRLCLIWVCRLICCVWVLWLFGFLVFWCLCCVFLSVFMMIFFIVFEVCGFVFCWRVCV